MKLRSALELDPGNTLVGERLRHARAHDQGRDGRADASPTSPPVLTFLETPTRGGGRHARAARRGHGRPRPGARASTGRGQRARRRAACSRRRAGRASARVTLPHRPGVRRWRRARTTSRSPPTDVRGNDARRVLRGAPAAALLRDARVPALRGRRRGGAARPRPGWSSALRRRRALRSRFNPYIAGAPVMSDEHVLRPPEAAGAHPERAAPQQPDDHRRAAHRQDDLPLPPAPGAAGGRRDRLPLLPGARRTCRACPRRRSSTRSCRTSWSSWRSARRRRARLRFRPRGDALRRPRLQPRPAARDRRAQDAHAAAREAGPADRRGGRAQRVLRARQPAAAQHLHEDLLRAPGRDHERRRHQAALEERRQPLVQLLRRGRADRVHARGGGGADPRAGRGRLPLRGGRRGAILEASRPQALPDPEVLHPRGQPHARGRAAPP